MKSKNGVSLQTRFRGQLVFERHDVADAPPMPERAANGLVVRNGACTTRTTGRMTPQYFDQIIFDKLLIRATFTRLHQSIHPPINHNLHQSVPYDRGIAISNSAQCQKHTSRFNTMGNP